MDPSDSKNNNSSNSSVDIDPPERYRHQDMASLHVLLKIEFI